MRVSPNIVSVFCSGPPLSPAAWPTTTMMIHLSVRPPQYTNISLIRSRSGGFPQWTLISFVFPVVVLPVVQFSPQSNRSKEQHQLRAETTSPVEDVWIAGRGR